MCSIPFTVVVMPRSQSGHHSVRHIVRCNSVLVPNHADNGNIECRENVGRHRNT